jgi:hypothetical protein
VIDSTAMPLDAVIELIVTAARAHKAADPEQSKTHQGTMVTGAGERQPG